jgi:Ion channel
MAIKPTRAAHLRWRFLAALCRYVFIVWPVLSGLMAMQWLLGMILGYTEGWSIGDATYFTFVTGPTIGYGDLVPRHAVSRILAVVIGIIGTLVMALFAAIGVRALQQAAGDDSEQPPR